VIVAGAAPGTIRATFAGAAVTAGDPDTARRTVAGVAVPWEVPGVVSTGQTVIFHRGALDAAARPVLLRDHDLTRPIGTVVDARDDGQRMHAVGKVSAVPDGDHALVLAADGALPMFSVGADPTSFDVDDDGVVHVYAADWRELSLLSLGAYTAARVSTVTASQERPTMEPDQLTLDPADVDDAAPPIEATDVPDPDDDDPDDPTVTPITAAARPVPITAGARHPSRGRAQPSPYAGLTLRALAAQISAGQHDPRAARFAAAALRAQGPLAGGGIQAALLDVTLDGTVNIGGAYRPGYQAELVEIVGWGTPLIDALRQGDLQRGDYPTKSFNQWLQTPIVGLQTNEKDPIASGPVQIGPASCDVMTWAGGNDISQQTLDLGSPSFVEDYIRAAAGDYAKKSDTYAVSALLTAATPVTTLTTDTFIQIIQKLMGALNPATAPGGSYFLAMSNDVGVGLIGVPRDEGPAFWDGSVSFGSFTPTVNAGGLQAFVDPNLPARTYLLGYRNGATWYDLPGTPFNLRAVNVAQLGLDIAVYGYGACGIQYPGAFAKTTQP
jgi:hypothetical protein